MAFGFVAVKQPRCFGSKSSDLILMAEINLNKKYNIYFKPLNLNQTDMMWGWSALYFRLVDHLIRGKWENGLKTWKPSIGFMYGEGLVLFLSYTDRQIYMRPVVSHKSFLFVILLHF
jgi:hypothetical protein